MALPRSEIENLKSEVGTLDRASLDECKRIIKKLEGLARNLQHTDGEKREMATLAIHTLDDIVKNINTPGRNPNIRDAFKQLHPAPAAQEPFTVKKTK